MSLVTCKVHPGIWMQRKIRLFGIFTIKNLVRDCPYCLETLERERNGAAEGTAKRLSKEERVPSAPKVPHESMVPTSSASSTAPVAEAVESNEVIVSLPVADVARPCSPWSALRRAKQCTPISSWQDDINPCAFV